MKGENQNFKISILKRFFEILKRQISLKVSQVTSKPIWVEKKWKSKKNSRKEFGNKSDFEWFSTSV